MNPAELMLRCDVGTCRGFPLWLHFIPGIKFRTDNEPFKVRDPPEEQCSLIDQ
jgi:hypothetical protein